MKIQEYLKYKPLLYQINSTIKGKQQEWSAKRELNYYRNEAFRKGITLPGGELLMNSLRTRLAKRGIFPIPKRRGDLHIFLAYSLNNWESVLPLALKHFGRVTTFSWRSGGFFDNYNEWSKWHNDLNANILDAFNKAHLEQPVDVMVGYVSDFNMTKEILLEIREKGVVIFNMNWDDKLYFSGNVEGQPRSIKGIVSAVDLNLTNAPDSCIKYLVEGGLAMFWPEAAHPDIHKPYDVQFEFDTSFVGSKNKFRKKFIDNLRKMGIKVNTFGIGWENGPLSDQDMIKLYSQSKINLGFAGVGYSSKLMCLKGRDFEVPMSGGLYLTQDNPELKLVYEIGKEIVTYKDEKDCCRKIRWLLDNPDDAERIRKAGRERALRDHTWEKRFSEAFKIAGLLH